MVPDKDPDQKNLCPVSGWCLALLLFLFFFSSRRRHTRYIGDWSSDVCSSDLGKGGLKILRQGQQAGVTPHAGRALRDLLARNLRAESIVIVADFEWRETIVTDGAGLVSPALPAFATSQFVLGHGLLFLSSSRETSKSALKAKSSFPGVEKEERDAEKCYAPRISCSPFPGESWHLAVRIDDPDPVAVASQGSSLSHSA